MSEAIRRAAVLRRLNEDVVDVGDGNRFVFKYGAQSLHGLAPGTFGIYPNDDGDPTLIVKCPQCGQLSRLIQNIDNEGRIEREVICPGCGWLAHALLHNWRETWRRIVGEYPGNNG